MYCTSNSHLTLIGCTVSSNQAIGGEGDELWCSPMSGCTGALGDGGDGYGGGIYISSSSSLTIVGCIITDNLTLGGHGGVYYDMGGLAIEGANGGMASGGGIYCCSAAIINDCNIFNNAAIGGTGGDGIDAGGKGGSSYGGGVYGNVTINNCTINGNFTIGGDGGNAYIGRMNGTGHGGGAYGQLVMRDCIISENIAQHGGSTSEPYEICGGGLALTNNSEITNCLITDNNCIYGIPEGKAVACMGESQVIISNCTIAGHNDEPAPAVSCLSGSNLECYNCILWNNNGYDFWKNISSTASFSYCCTEQIISGTGNIHTDPCFVTGPLGDYYLSQTAAGQAVNSPCVDAGSDTAANLKMDIFTTCTDHIGDAGTVDMGYHYPMPNPADIDGDGDVDLFDYAILAAQWQQPPSVPSADIAPPGGDGIVDGLDIGVLADNWPEGL